MNSKLTYTTILSSMQISKNVYFFLIFLYECMCCMVCVYMCGHMYTPIHAHVEVIGHR